MPARLLISTLSLLSVVGMPIAVAAQTPAGWDSFAKEFQAYAAADGVVGASALVMRDGRITGRVVVGDQNLEAKVAVDDATIFHWGSITKTLTAIAILQLRDRGKLSLDDKIVRFVPELNQMHDSFGAMNTVTLRMLLSHSAGFRNGTWPYGDGKPWEPFEPTTWNQLVAMMPYQELLFRPGSRYGYSNPAFIYLARVIEQVSGDPWDAYVQKNIFSPLGLTQSYFRTTPYFLAQNRSHNYTIVGDSATPGPRVIDNGADFDPGITTPNGGWNSPLGDLARYTAFLTNSAPDGSGSTANYAHVLSQESLAEMWKPVVPMAAGYEAAPDQHMGLSFFLSGQEPHRIIGHTGSQAGFRSFFYFNPVSKAAVIAVFNTTNQFKPADAQYRHMHQSAQALVR
jgi:CubicO group peptidase (beta-lactamase class C family)